MGKERNFLCDSVVSWSLPGVAKHLVNFASLLLRHYLKFSECFCALLTVKYGRFFTLVLFGFENEHIFWKYNPGKMLDFRVGSNWLIFCLLNFEGCQLWHQLSQTFLHQFQNFLCPLCCKFPEFCKAFLLHYILMILKEVMAKNQKIKKSENMPIWANTEI